MMAAYSASEPGSRVNLRALALQHRHSVLNTLGHLGVCHHVLGVEAPNHANLQPLDAFLKIRREVHDRPWHSPGRQGHARQ